MPFFPLIFQEGKKSCKLRKKAQQQRKPLSLCNYILFFSGGVEDKFSPPARMFGAKSLWKSTATAATNQSNTPRKATDHRNSAFPPAAMTYMTYIMEKMSRGILRHRLMATAAVMHTEQQANINTSSGGWYKRGAVRDYCRVQSVNRHIKRYYCSADSSVDGRGRTCCRECASAFTSYCNMPVSLNLPVFLVVLLMPCFSVK